MKTYEGNLVIKKAKVAIVVARFNELITTKLLTGAIDSLKRHNINENDIDVYWVPGSFEIPATVNKILEKKNYDGVITLGCIIRGETTHYDHICNVVSKAINDLSLKHPLPIIFGILTCEDVNQAMDRTGIKKNVGSNAALSLIEMVNLYKNIEE